MQNNSSINKLLDLGSKFSKKRIFVIGDIMLDEYIIGSTYRISPEAPVPIINTNDINYTLGGAANVAMNLKSLGAIPILVGVIGKDEQGKRIEKLLKNNKINNFLLKKQDTPTILKSRIISKNQQIVRIDREGKISDYFSKNIINIFKKNIENIDLLLVSDYGKGTIINIKDYIKLCKQYKIPIIIDPKGNSFEKYKNAEIITPNLSEFEKIQGKCLNLKNLEEKAANLIAKLNLKALLITRGKDGMSLIQKNRKPFHIKALNIPIADVVGAGDTVIANFSTCYSVGLNMKDSTIIANTAASMVVRIQGTANVNINSLQKKLLINRKILSINELLFMVKNFKKNKKKIIMTNGCFDILHYGHVNFLHEAKKFGDVLIVAINSDSSIRKLKGPLRPINSLKSRSEILSSINVIDFIVSFNEVTPINLIKKIIPNILVKGGDYKKNEIIGSDFVLKNGGTLKIIKYNKGFSTTKIIKKINKLKK